MPLNPAANAADAAAIDALLPQTQCTRCGYQGCRPYAEALARGEVALNRCPPGGAALIVQLATLLGRAPLPLDADCGREGPTLLAFIDAAVCIGCARCLPPCPTDAIVGAPNLLHTVVPQLCTGCELCLPACPVDCITMQPRATGDTAPAAADNRQRYQQHVTRHEQQRRSRAALLAERKRGARTPESGS